MFVFMKKGQINIGLIDYVIYIFNWFNLNKIKFFINFLCMYMKLNVKKNISKIWFIVVFLCDVLIV